MAKTMFNWIGYGWGRIRCWWKDCKWWILIIIIGQIVECDRIVKKYIWKIFDHTYNNQRKSLERNTYWSLWHHALFSIRKTTKCFPIYLIDTIYSSLIWSVWKRERRRENIFAYYFFFSSYSDVCWWYFSSFRASFSLSPSRALNEIGTLDRSIHSTWAGVRFTICVYIVLHPHLHRACTHPNSLIEIRQFFDRQTTRHEQKRCWMHTCFLLAYVCVMMIIYQETSVASSLSLFILSSPLLSFLMRVAVVRPHQTLFFSRIVINSFTEGERDRARGADKTFRKVLPCDGLSVVCSFAILEYFFLPLYVKRGILFVSSHYDWFFFIDGIFVPFPRDSRKRMELFCKWKTSKQRNIILPRHAHTFTKKKPDQITLALPRLWFSEEKIGRRNFSNWRLLPSHVVTLLEAVKSKRMSVHRSSIDDKRACVVRQKSSVVHVCWMNKNRMLVRLNHIRIDEVEELNLPKRQVKSMDNFFLFFFFYWDFPVKKTDIQFRISTILDTLSKKRPMTTNKND